MKESHNRPVKLSEVLILGGMALLYFYYANRTPNYRKADLKNQIAQRNLESANNYISSLSNKNKFDQSKAELDWIWQELRKALQLRFPGRNIQPLNKISSFSAPGGSSGNYGAFARIINDTPSLFDYMGRRNIDPKDIEDCDTIGSLCFPIKDRKG